MSRGFEADIVVIGAGAVGLACAYLMHDWCGKSVVVVEAENRPGAGTTSRGSGVSHAGIYYPPGSPKAEFCVRGRHELEMFCRRHGVPHDRIGKYIVAVEPGELVKLFELYETARTNGAKVEMVGPKTLARAEPNVKAVAAIYSPRTGVLDVGRYIDALVRRVVDDGSRILLNSKVRHIVPNAEGYTVFAGEHLIKAGAVVNAAGLGAIDVARVIDGYPPDQIPVQRLVKGVYYGLRPEKVAPVNHLVYPLPVADGLGVHATRDLAGWVKFGPDATEVSEVDYSVPAVPPAPFVAAIRRYLPDIEAGDLVPRSAGIRPKLVGRDEFVILDSSAHGMKRLVNLFGIDSPGVTASLAIADYVLGMVI